MKNGVLVRLHVLICAFLLAVRMLVGSLDAFRSVQHV